MKKNRSKRKLKQNFIKMISIIFFFAAGICTLMKIGNVLMQNTDKLSTVTTGFIMPVGAKAYIDKEYGYEYIDGAIYSLEYSDTDELDYTKINQKQRTADNIESSQSEVNRPTASTVDGETVYSIIERKIMGSGMSYDDFFVKNSTSFDINIAEELSKKPDAQITLNSDIQVLIVHTHTSESYIDKDVGYYPASFYPRCTDPNYNIVAVGEAIKKQLDAGGINTLHDTSVHDNPSYNGAYTRAASTIMNDLSSYPSIQVVLDIHRDAIGNDETGRVKPTFTYNGRKAAQIMILSGCDEGGTWYFPDWEYNLRLAMRIQQKAESMYPGMTRPLNFSASEYNMSLTRNSLLIEIGSDVNTLDEAVYSGELLGNVLKEVLTNLAVR